MKIPTPAYRCPLGTLQPDVIDLDQVKQDGWRTQRILVIQENDDRLDFVEREYIRRIGERLYGRRQKQERGHD